MHGSAGTAPQDRRRRRHSRTALLRAEPQRLSWLSRSSSSIGYQARYNNEHHRMRLNLTELDFVGRTQEKQQLWQAWQQQCCRLGKEEEAATSVCPLEPDMDWKMSAASRPPPPPPPAPDLAMRAGAMRDIVPGGGAAAAAAAALPAPHNQTSEAVQLVAALPLLPPAPHLAGAAAVRDSVRGGGAAATAAVPASHTMETVAKKKNFMEPPARTVTMSTTVEKKHVPVAIIAGASGVGKSALVRATFADGGGGNGGATARSTSSNTATRSTASPPAAESFLFCTGKFLQVPSHRPWQAILDALDDLCVQVAHANETAHHYVADVLLDALGLEAGMLVSLLPSLAVLCGEMSQNKMTRGGQGSTTITGPRAEFAFARLKQVLGKLLHVLCATLGHAVVLFIDDLHWADASSVSMIEALAQYAVNHSIPNFMFVLAYRDDQDSVDEASQPSASIGGSSTSTSSNRNNDWQQLLDTVVPLVRIGLHGMPVDSINELVASAIDCTFERSLPLAKVIHRKTIGNVFFAISFLGTLEDERLLTFSYESFQWQWDVDTIMAEVDVSTNLANLLLRRFTKLPGSTQKVLMVGACIGTRFDLATVKYLLAGRDDIDLQRLFENVQDRNCPERGYESSFVMTETSILEALQVAVNENLLNNRTGSDVFKFAHDQIQHTIYTLLPVCAERDQLHMKIGKYCYDAYIGTSAAAENVAPQPGHENSLLMAVEQMDQARAQLVADDERLRLAELNYEAASLVASLSAFDSAVAYCRVARSLVVDAGGWTGHFRLMLKLADALGFYLYATGNNVECQELMHEILMSTDSIEDKIASYGLLVRCAAAQGKFRECVGHGAVFMEQLSIVFHTTPNRKTFMVEYRKIKHKVAHMMRGGNVHELPVIEDAGTIAAMDVLTEITGAALALGDFSLIYYCGIRLMQLTCDRGICQAAPSAIALYGAFLANVLDDFEQGFQMGQLGINLSDCIDVKWQKGRAIVMNNHWFGFLGRPIHQTLNLALEAHNLCMEDGDVHYGCLCLINYCWSYLWAGLPLDPLLKDHEHLVSVLNEYSREYELRMHYSGTIIARVMSGRESRQSAFKFIEDATGDDWAFVKMKAYWQKFIVAVYFNDLETINSHRKRMEEVTTQLVGSSVASFIRFFYLAMANFMLFDQTRRRKFVRRARKILARFDQWTRKGNVNCHHMHQILLAESLCASSDRSKFREEVRKAYEKAILSSSRGGFLHHVALANERAALYCLRHDNAHGSFYLMRAITYYRDWNAYAKVDDILIRYRSFCTEEFSDSFTSGAFYGQSRLEKFMHRRKSARQSIAALRREAEVSS